MDLLFVEEFAKLANGTVDKQKKPDDKKCSFPGSTPNTTNPSTKLDLQAVMDNTIPTTADTPSPVIALLHFLYGSCMGNYSVYQSL